MNLAQGHPNYSGTFIPEIWSGKLVTKFYAATVFGDIANTDYEGEIKDMGDKVHIRTVPNIIIRDYAKGQNLQTQRPESPNVELNIDKAKYFQFVCDDIDKHQMDIKAMDKWGEDAGQQMKIVVDTGILGDIYADAASANKGAAAGVKSGSINLGAVGTPLAVDKTNVLDVLVDLGTAMDEQNLPESDRWIVIPAWMSGMIKKSDLKDASLTGDGESVLRNGRLGRIDRLTLYMSNNLSSVTDGSYTAYNIIAGHKSGLTFASQMTNMETLRAESTFGNIVRGLNVYGYQVVKPESIFHLYARKG
jgi:hypothetical protein